MPSKQQDVAKTNISPFLFLSMDGEPMSFYLRPGPVKRELQSLITAGGGMMCNIQKPGAILLVDPADKGSITEANAHRYISTRYIHDCVEKDEQLNMEDYRLNSDAIPNPSVKPNRSSEGSAANQGGRAAYTSEEDAAILKFVSKHKSEVGGNRLWQEMEKQKVTSHTWQSMKYRYRVRLAKKQSEVVQEETTDKETEAAEREIKVGENQETHVEKPSGAEDTPPHPTHSAESDLTQIDSQSVPADSKQPEIVDAQTSISPREEKVQQVSTEKEEQPAESTNPETVKVETSNSLLEESILDSQTDFHLFLADSQETQNRQTVFSTQKESVPEDSPVAYFVSQDALFQKKSKEKQRVSPEPEQPQPQPPRRRTRRQLQLEELLGPEPYAKKLRSSSSSASSSSPQPLRKVKTAFRSALLKDTAEEQPPSKRARGKGAPAVQETEAVVLESETTVQESEVAEQEGEQEESESAHDQETAQPDAESISVPQKEEKKKEKRKPRILEMAAREFDSDSVSDRDEAPDLQKQTVVTTEQPASPDPSSDAACTQSSPEGVPSPQVVVPETQTQASTSNCPPETVCPQPEEVAAPAAPEAVSATSKLHLFIFCDSQEDESQSSVGEDAEIPPKPKETGNKDAPYSLTQALLEEDKQTISELMNQTKQDLFSVTKALLRTSGDFSAALDLLLNPCSISGPFWDRHDDNLLLSADPEVRQQLEEKYGKEALLKRILFLEVKG